MSNRATLALKMSGISVALIALVWIVFGQTVNQRFVNFDDGSYVYRNSQVLHGISMQGIKWAFTHPVAANWHPVTIISHMLDCQWFGVSPAGHHLTNIVLHAVATLLLFFVLVNMTEKLWPGAFVAAVFAVHPLHVESVAWVSERKDVLSAVFFILTLIAYVHYVHRASIVRYLLVFVSLALGLMAKPMLVTAPFVLLLLDYWPLDRFQRTEDRRHWTAKPVFRSLILEKIPLLALSAATSAAALTTQAHSINLIKHISLSSRIANAFVSLMTYVGQTILPRNLAVFYPYPENISGWKVVAAIAGFVVITSAAVILRRNRPYFLVGWLWFVGMLVPVIGIVQVGVQAHADRYNYLPQIGLCLVIAWAAADLSQNWRYQQVALAASSVAAVILLTWSARTDASYWLDSESLWRHALVAAPDNETARQHLADALLDKGEIDGAVEQAQAAVKLAPESADAHGMLGAALARSARLDEAVTHLQTALQLNPRLPQVHFNLGNIFMQRGDMADAIIEYESELELYPAFAEGHNNLGNALLRTGRTSEALENLRTALSLNPRYAQAHNNVAIALSQTGDLPGAVAEWNRTLTIDPDNLEAECNLGWVLSTSQDSAIRDGARAVELTQRALRLSGGKNARIWRLAAAAYAETGRFEDAIKAAQRGIIAAETEGNSTLVQTLQANLRLFEQGSPLRD